MLRAVYVADDVVVGMKLRAVWIVQRLLASLVPAVEFPVCLGDRVVGAVEGGSRIENVNKRLESVESSLCKLADQNLILFSARIVVSRTIILMSY